MTEDIQGLIDKIKQDGISAAKEKSEEIEALAKKRAELLIKNAQRQAEGIIKEAEENAFKTQEKTKSALAQTARDMLLVLKKEINLLLERVIAKDIHQSLSPQGLAEILPELIKQATGKEMVITFKKHDLEILEKEFFAKLSHDLKKGITLKSSDSISAGFTISYDGGKSQYDFSDKALAEYISSALKPKLLEIMQKAVS